MITAFRNTLPLGAYLLHGKICDFCLVQFSYLRICATAFAFNKYVLAIRLNIGVTGLAKVMTKKARTMSDEQ